MKMRMLTAIVRTVVSTRTEVPSRKKKHALTSKSCGHRITRMAELRAQKMKMRKRRSLETGQHYRSQHALVLAIPLLNGEALVPTLQLSTCQERIATTFLAATVSLTYHSLYCEPYHAHK